MKLKKSSLAMILAVVLTLTMAVGGTLAYLTDTDAKVNEFTMGDVDIELDEEYVQGTELLPGVEVSKTAGIKNIGKNDAWVIMTVAVPAVNETPVVEATFDENGWTSQSSKPQSLKIEGEDYLLYPFVYNTALAAGDATSNLLKSITLDKRVDYNPIDGQYAIVDGGKVTPITSKLDAGKVYVNAYAIQKEGFASAEDAYKAYMTQWGVANGWTEDQILLPSAPARPEPLPEPDETVSNVEALKDAIANPDTNVVHLTAGNYALTEINRNNNPSGAKELTITGTKDTVIDMPDGYSAGVNAADCELTLMGVTVEFSNNNYNGFTHAKKVVYKDCVINGMMTNYAPEAEFINCEFNVKGDFYNIWTYGGEEVTFTNCTFNSDGKAVLVYNEDTADSFVGNIKFVNCTFNDDGALSDLKGAVETGTNGGNTTTSNKYNLTFTDCTVNGYEKNTTGIATDTTFFGNKNSMDKDHLNVIIDGVDVY